MATKQRRVIRISVDTRNTDKEYRRLAQRVGKVNRQLKKQNNTIRSIGRGFSSFKRAVGAASAVFAVLAGAKALAGLTRVTDELSLLQDRINVFTGDAEKGAEVFEQLNESAFRTKTSVGALANVYNRVALATSDLNISSTAILGVTEALQQTFRLSGSTIAEATASTIQLTQGLSAGALRGQELRSVLEANAVLTGLLAKEFDVSRGQLIKLAETGAITSQRVFKVLGENFVELRNRAGKLNQTFEQSSVILKNELSIALKDFNEATGLSRKFADSINKITLVIRGFRKSIKGDDDSGGESFLAPFIYGIKDFLRDESLMFNIMEGLIGAAEKYETLVEEGKVYFGAFPDGSRLRATRDAYGNFGLQIADTNTRIVDFTEQVLKSFKDINKIVGEDVLPGFVEIPKTLEDVEQATKNVAYFYRNRYAQAIIEASKAGKKVLKTIEDLNKEFEGQGATEEYRRRLFEIKKAQLEARLSAKGTTLSYVDFEKRVKNLKEELLGLKEEQEEEVDVLKSLNQEYLKGDVTLRQYEATRSQIRMDELAKDFKDGSTSVKEFNEASLEFQDTWADANTFQTGIQKYLDSVETLSESISGIVEGSFQSLEDELLNFIDTGKFKIKDFVQSILDDVNRLLVRQLVTAPLADAFKSIIKGVGSSNAFSGQSGNLLQATSQSSLESGKARGGVISSASLISTPGFGRSLVGERGPEAILPLTRTPTGELGVSSKGGGSGSNVVVNVSNNVTSAQATTRERTGSDGTKFIDVMVEEKVRETITSGRLDKTFQQQYGLNRRGV